MRDKCSMADNGLTLIFNLFFATSPEGTIDIRDAPVVIAGAPRQLVDGSRLLLMGQRVIEAVVHFVGLGSVETGV